MQHGRNGMPPEHTGLMSEHCDAPPNISPLGEKLKDGRYLENLGFIFRTLHTVAVLPFHTYLTRPSIGNTSAFFPFLRRRVDAIQGQYPLSYTVRICVAQPMSRDEGGTYQGKFCSSVNQIGGIGANKPIGRDVLFDCYVLRTSE